MTTTAITTAQYTGADGRPINVGDMACGVEFSGHMEIGPIESIYADSVDVYAVIGGKRFAAIFVYTDRAKATEIALVQSRASLEFILKEKTKLEAYIARLRSGGR